MEYIGPHFDEGMGVEGLLLGKHSTQSPSSLELWLQRRSEKLQTRPGVVGQSQRDCVPQPKVAVTGYLRTGFEHGSNPEGGCGSLDSNNEHQNVIERGTTT